ncbi:MAG: 30S ribosomal protein S20 [Candidatus Omnitrophica bacterium]|nr:30S ribosomal protein S20 [Candidatus Omnitrophota bacterium]
MPNIKSAEKRMRSDAKKHLQNQATLSELHTLYRKLVDQVKEKSGQAQEQARTLISKLDKAVSRGIIPHGRADRKKARIGKLLTTKETGNQSTETKKG